MNLRASVALAAMLLLLGSPAIAGSDSSKSAAATATPAPSGPSFDSLSAGRGDTLK